MVTIDTEGDRADENADGFNCKHVIHNYSSIS